MMLFGLFKTRAQREQVRLADTAKFERAYHQGGQATQQITHLIDQHFDDVAAPAGIRTRAVLLEELDHVRLSGKEQDVVQTLAVYNEVIDEFEQKMCQDAYDALGEWKYLETENGLKDDLLVYITRRAKEVASAMREGVAQTKART
jgi:hypothetical protein